MRQDTYRPWIELHSKQFQNSVVPSFFDHYFEFLPKDAATWLRPHQKQDKLDAQQVEPNQWAKRTGKEKENINRKELNIAL